MSSAWANYNPSMAKGYDKGYEKGYDKGYGKGDGKGKGKRRGAEIPEKDRNGLDLPSLVETRYTKHPSLEDYNADTVRLRHFIEIRDIDRDRELQEEVHTPIYKMDYVPFEDAIRNHLKRRYTEPTPIQMQGWPLLMDGYDLIGIAPTGSGKTLCYLLPLLEHVRVQQPVGPQDGCIALILLPSKELCQQVAQEARNWLKFCGSSQYRVVACSRGDARPQRGRCDILCASSGKLGSLLQENSFDIMRATYVVVDEADKLLSDPTQHHDTFDLVSPLEILTKGTRKDKQTALFTATWQDALKRYPLRRGLCVTVDGKALKACKDINQDFWCPGRNDDPDEDCWEANETREQALVKAIRCICFPDDEPVDDIFKATNKVLVFVNAFDKPSEAVHHLVDVLDNSHILEPGEVAGFIRGTWTSDEALEKFKDSESPRPRVLISTDVLSRGFDCPACTCVVNYEMPTGKNALHNYVHRIGRTGRAGLEGQSLTLLQELDLRYARELVEMMKLNGHEAPKWLQDESKNFRYWKSKWDEHIRSLNLERRQWDAPSEAPAAVSEPPTVPNVPVLQQSTELTGTPSWWQEMPRPDYRSEERYRYLPL